MTIYEAPNMTEGIDDAILDIVTAVPSFIPMFLVFIFGIVLIGGIISQRRKIGTADFPMWTTLASISTLIVTLPLTLLEGLIQVQVLSIVVIVTIFSGFWLFLDRNRNEI